MEDLVPIDVAVCAARRYLAEYLGWDEEEVARISEERLERATKGGKKPLFEALETLLSSLDETVSVHKVGFGRSVVAVLEEDRTRSEGEGELTGVRVFETRMAPLMARLNEMVRETKRKRTVGRVKSRIRRVRRQFLRDHPESVTKDEALRFLEEIEAIVGDDGGNREGRLVGDLIQDMGKKYCLDDTTETRTVGDHVGFRKGIRDLEYAPLRESQEGEAGFVEAAGNGARDSEPRSEERE